MKYLLFPACLLLMQSTAFFPNSPLNRRFGRSKLACKKNDRQHIVPTIPPALAFFDVNSDGKLDEKDLVPLHSNIKKDVAAALSIGLLCWALSASPAHAKGGGHGGGGGGSGGRYGGDSSYPAYKRSFSGKNEKYNRPFDPKACSNLPGEGELIGFLIDRGPYVKGVVVSVDESNCRAVAAELEGGSAELLQTDRNWINWAQPALFASLFSAAVVGDQIDKKKDKDFDRIIFEDELFVTEGAPPKSGRFVGETMESDGSIQIVRANLQFANKGKISGSGADSVDGSYRVQGAWKGSRVRWVESYNEGFSVTVRGDVKEDGTIDCRFRSSRGIQGRFKLKKK